MDRTVTENIRRILAECAGGERSSPTMGINRSVPGVRYYFTPPEEPQLQKLLDCLNAAPGEEEATLQKCLAEYEEPFPGARKRLEQVLRILTTAYAAAELKRKAQAMIDDLDER